MFGPSIMVAPFYESKSIKRQVRLPAGNWYDFYTGKRVGSQETVTVTAQGLGNRIPLFVKEGAIIPMLTKAVSSTEDAYGHPLTVQVYGNCDGRFDLYEDDGKSFDYEKGEYRIRRITLVQDQSGAPKVRETLVRNNGPAMFGPVQAADFMSK